ncbi:MAG: phosphatidylserine decarboxylase family protein [Candidatus Dadabacteria bacterium]
MTNPRSKIAIEGLPYIGICGLLAWVTALFGFNTLSIILAIVTCFIIYFFRDPERTVPQDPYAVVSPADGRVVEVENSVEESFLNREMKRVGIFLSITDCHINRFPVSGKVVGTKYIHGSFHIADARRASAQNERLAILIETEDRDQIVVVQVAGFIARRIVSYISIGDSLQKGERFGMIKFGSRVDIYLPLRCEVSISVGDKIRGAETIIGWLKGEGK